MIHVDPQKPRGLVWLASYPKSGNTWLRVFLYHVMRIAAGFPREADELNKLDRSSMYEARLFSLYANLLGKPLQAASVNEVARIRPKVHQMVADRLNTVALIKTHNLLGHVGETPTVNFDVSAGAIYIVRDPRDIVPSLAKHHGTTIDETIAMMAKSAYSTNNGREQASEIWGSWSEHVLSWTMTPSETILVVRYEDMLAKPTETFAAMVRHLRQSPPQEQILEAIELSSFDKLQKQEEASDFRERSPRADRFFASGKAGTWREKLTAAQAAEVERVHETQMRKFGYID